MLYVRFPLSLRNVEDPLHERGIDISHETVWFWWLRFGAIFAAEIRKRRIERMRSRHWRWHLDETGTGDAPVPTDAKSAEVRLRPRLRHHHFNTERGLSSRPLFKANRAAALTEWRGLCAV